MKLKVEDNMPLIPINEKFPLFLLQALKQPKKAWQAFQPVVKRPEYIWIEITARCNIRCRSCSKWYGADSKSEMGYEQFESIFSEVRDSAQFINLTGNGEFFFHRDAERIFELFMKHPKIHMNFTSNGQLASEEWLKRLSQKDCSVIYSLDGVTAPTYNFNRPKSDLNKVKFALARSQELEMEAGGRKNFPYRRHINFVVMRENMHEIVGAIKWAEEFGVDTLRLTFMNNWGFEAEFWEKQNPLNYPEDLATILHQAHQEAAQRNVLLISPPLNLSASANCPDSSPKSDAPVVVTDCPAPAPDSSLKSDAPAVEINCPAPAPDSSPKSDAPAGWLKLFQPMHATHEMFPYFPKACCHTPFNSIYFSATGNATVCCGAASISLGNINHQSLEEIWNGKPFRLLRSGMAIGAHTSYCRICDLPYGLAKGNPRMMQL